MTASSDMDWRKEFEGIDLPGGLTPEAMGAFLENHVGQPVPERPGAGEDLILDLSPDGKSTSTKISNLQFRLLDVLLGLGEIGFESFVPGSNTAKAVFVAVRFICQLKGLSTAEVRRRDAEVLLALFKLQVEKETATIDRLYRVMDQKVPVLEISDSLKRLEKLSCIKHTDTEIYLIEKIVLIKL